MYSAYYNYPNISLYLVNIQGLKIVEEVDGKVRNIFHFMGSRGSIESAACVFHYVLHSSRKQLLDNYKLEKQRLIKEG